MSGRARAGRRGSEGSRGGFGAVLAGLVELPSEGRNMERLPLEVGDDRVGGAGERRWVRLDLSDGGEHVGVLLDGPEDARVFRDAHAAQLDEAEAAQVVDVEGRAPRVLAARLLAEEVE